MWHANWKPIPLQHSVWIYHSISTSDVLYRAMLSHISETAADTAWLEPDKSTNTCLLCRRAAWRAFYLDFGLFKVQSLFSTCLLKCSPLSFFLVEPCISSGSRDLIGQVLSIFHAYFYPLIFTLSHHFENFSACIGLCWYSLLWLILESLSLCSISLCKVNHHKGCIHNSWGADTQYCLFSEGYLKVRWNDSLMMNISVTKINVHFWTDGKCNTYFQ